LVFEEGFFGGVGVVDENQADLPIFEPQPGNDFGNGAGLGKFEGVESGSFFEGLQGADGFDVNNHQDSASSALSVLKCLKFKRPFSRRARREHREEKFFIKTKPKAIPFYHARLCCWGIEALLLDLSLEFGT
jgi:hypothetical protein